MEVKQFKLASGEEIVCEVLEWPDIDGESADIVVRNILKIVAYDQPQTATGRYYTFVPWMVFQDEENMFQLINYNHIVGEANPSARLFEQYLNVVRIKTGDSDESTSEVKKQLEDYLNHMRVALSTGSDSIADSDVPTTDTKVIKFPGRTYH